MKSLKINISYLFCNFIFLSASLAGAAQQQYREGKINRPGFTLFFKIIDEKGPFVVILAGGPGSTVDYMKPVADSLSKFYQCILLEQRGTGRSILKKYDSTRIKMNLYVEDIEALRKHINSEKIILIGNSWGSLLSFLYGIQYPLNTTAIISLGSSPISNEYAEIFNDNFRLRLLPEEKAIRNKWKEKLKDSLTFVQANYQRDKTGMPAYYYNREIGLKAAASLKQTDFNYHVLKAFDTDLSHFDIRPVLHKIISPVLLIQGRQDLAGESNIIETSNLVKQSKLKFIERCGHIPWEEKPTETWQTIYTFLNQNEYFR